MNSLTWYEFLKLFALTIWEARPNILKKDFWIIEFPDYYPICFDCNLGNEDCPICKYRTLAKMHDILDD